MRPGIGLLLDDLEWVKFMDPAERSPEGIEHQVGDVIRQRPAHQKLERKRASRSAPGKFVLS